MEKTKNEIRQEKLIEQLADLEHKQWMSWTHYVANANLGKLPKELMDKWVNNWKPYFLLTEDEKEKDRIWARKVLKIATKNEKKRIQKIIEKRIVNYRNLYNLSNKNLEALGMWTAMVELLDELNIEKSIKVYRKNNKNGKTR